MAITLQGSGPIVEGWGPPPQLHAPEIGSLVGAILRNRLGQQELTQKSIGDTIKQLQQQRESAAYTYALQKAGLLPEGDYGGLGIKGGESLADMIQRQQAEKAMEAHRASLLEIAQQRVGQGGGGRGRVVRPSCAAGRVGHSFAAAFASRWAHWCRARGRSCLTARRVFQMPYSVRLAGVFPCATRFRLLRIENSRYRPWL
jgi:hypothetical protein